MPLHPPVRRGYATEEELQHPPSGVRLLQLSQFCELLRFGLLMGVDDGCEPTAEEVEAGLVGKAGSM